MSADDETVAEVLIEMASNDTLADVQRAAEMLAEDLGSMRIRASIYEEALKDIAGCNGGEGYMPSLARTALRRAEDFDQQRKP